MEPNIPPRKTKCRKVGNVQSGIFERLKSLEIGESFEIPLNTRKSIHRYAKDVGIKVATRQLGSDTTTTVYRIG